MDPVTPNDGLSPPLQGYLDHKNPHLPVGPYSRTVPRVLWGGGGSYWRGTPVGWSEQRTSLGLMCGLIMSDPVNGVQGNTMDPVTPDDGGEAVYLHNGFSTTQVRFFFFCVDHQPLEEWATYWLRTVRLRREPAPLTDILRPS